MAVITTDYCGKTPDRSSRNAVLLNCMVHSRDGGPGGIKLCPAGQVKSKVRKSLAFHADDCRFYPTGSRATPELFKGKSEILRSAFLGRSFK